MSFSLLMIPDASSSDFIQMCSLLKVLDLIHSTVGDQRVKIELVDGFDPLPVSSADEKSFGFQIIKKTVLDMFPTVTVAPGRITNDLM